MKNFANLSHILNKRYRPLETHIFEKHLHTKVYGFKTKNLSKSVIFISKRYLFK